METRKVRFDVAFQPGEIEYLDKKLRQKGPLTVTGQAELLGATEEIRVKGKLRVEMEAECDRCLESASFPLETEFDLFYRPSPLEENGEESSLSSGDVELGFYEGGGLELRDILQEQILLALPMQRVCSAACKGICPSCGQNRNLADCNCQVKPVDDRWAALKKFKQ
jgi:uncharacterized protein